MYIVNVQKYAFLYIYIFFVLNLYPATLTSSVTSCSSFCSSYRFLHNHASCLAICGYSLIFSFPSLFSCLIALASSTLSRRLQCRYVALFLVLEVKHSVFHDYYDLMLATGFLQIPFPGLLKFFWELLTWINVVFCQMHFLDQLIIWWGVFSFDCK